MDTISKQLDIKFDPNIDNTTNLDQQCKNVFKNNTNFRLDRLKLKP